MLKSDSGIGTQACVYKREVSLQRNGIARSGIVRTVPQPTATVCQCGSTITPAAPRELFCKPEDQIPDLACMLHPISPALELRHIHGYYR